MVAPVYGPHAAPFYVHGVARIDPRTVPEFVWLCLTHGRVFDQHRHRSTCRLARYWAGKAAKSARAGICPPDSDGVYVHEEVRGKFWAHVDKLWTKQPWMKTPCWRWLGQTTKGRGRFSPGRGQRQIGAHRIAYMITHGKIPEGLVLDHLCCAPLCVNPAHLEPVTSIENSRRGGAKSAARRSVTFPNVPLKRPQVFRLRNDLR